MKIRATDSAFTDVGTAFKLKGDSIELDMELNKFIRVQTVVDALEGKAGADELTKMINEAVQRALEDKSSVDVAVTQVLEQPKWQNYLAERHLEIASLAVALVPFVQTVLNALPK